MVPNTIATHRVSISYFSILIKAGCHINPNDILLPSTHVIESLVWLHCQCCGVHNLPQVNVEMLGSV